MANSNTTFSAQKWNPELVRQPPCENATHSPIAWPLPTSMVETFPPWLMSSCRVTGHGAGQRRRGPASPPKEQVHVREGPHDTCQRRKATGCPAPGFAHLCS